VLILVLLAGGAAGWWKLRPRPSDKEQIERVITEVEAAIEQKSPRQVMTHVSHDYHDSTGTTYREARLLSLRLLRIPEQIRVDILDYQGPVIADDLAKLRLMVQVNALSAGPSVAEASGEIRLLLRRERKGWKVISAEGWQEWVSGLE